MQKSNTGYSKGDIARIKDTLAEAGVVVSASLIGKVIRGERQNPSLLKAIIRFYQLKGIMERDYRKWLDSHDLSEIVS